MYLARRFSEAEYKPGDVIIQQGTRGDSFFLIYSGKVRVVRKKDNKQVYAMKIMKKSEMVKKNQVQPTATAMLVYHG